MSKFWNGKALNKAGFSICERYTTFWICQNMPWQSSEYTLGSKHARILNMVELQYGWICLNRTWICLNMSEFTIIDRVLNMYRTIHGAQPKYTCSTFHRVLNKPSKYTKSQNMASLWICQHYTGWWICLNKPDYPLIMSQYAWIWLYIYSILSGLYLKNRVLNIPEFWILMQYIAKHHCTNHWTVITRDVFRTLWNI